jgi:uncharacterized Zn finger protein
MVEQSSNRAEVGAALRGRPFVAARLLADALPPELETVFADAGLSLFPQREADLETDCSCPDWSPRPGKPHQSQVPGSFPGPGKPSGEHKGLFRFGIGC